MRYEYKKYYHPTDFKGRLNDVVTSYQAKSFNDIAKLRVSTETIRKRRDVIFQAYSDLKKMGYKIKEPLSIKTKHIQSLVDLWVSQNLTPSTISNRVSIFNTFFVFIGKHQCVKSPEEYVTDPALVKRSYVNKKDKSWTQNQINFDEIVQKVSDIDEYSVAHIKLMNSFGLRIREAVSIFPHESELDNSILLITRGTKGGRTRAIKIDNDEKREAISYAKSLCPNLDDPLVSPKRSTYQELRRLYYVLSKVGVTKANLGVTAHGLRHEYLNDKYESITGHPSPVRGGDIVDHELDKLARHKTMLDAGHGRISIGASYYGSRRKNKKSNPDDTPSD